MDKNDACCVVVGVEDEGVKRGVDGNNIVKDVAIAVADDLVGTDCSDAEKRE